MVLSENQSSLKPRLVSIIIPTFNRMGFLKDAIGSCLAQTWLQTEVIVVDDGSTDGTGREIEIATSRRAVGTRNDVNILLCLNSQ